MTIHQRSFDRRTFLKATGILAVGFSMSGTAAAQSLMAPRGVAKDAVDSWLTITPDNRITIFVGKVDLGTGARTALMQMAAEELDVPFNRIEMVMGDTATTPDQWLTAANLTIFQGGGELRRAAASARRALVERASQRLGVPAGDLIVEDAVVKVKASPERSLRYGELIGDGIKLNVDAKIELKKHPAYKLIGKSIPRVDIPGKVTGEFTYVHDVRVPGMLHARVIRSDDHGATIASVDDSAAKQVSGYVQTVRKGDFLAVVARNEWAAIKAANAMRVTLDRRHRPARQGGGVRRMAQASDRQGRGHAERRRRQQGASKAPRGASRRPTTSRCRRMPPSARPAPSPTSRTAS